MTDKISLKNIQKMGKTHDQRYLEITAVHRISFNVYNNLFIKAMNEILIPVSVSSLVHHFVNYANFQKDLKRSEKSDNPFLVTLQLYCKSSNKHPT